MLCGCAVDDVIESEIIKNRNVTRDFLDRRPLLNSVTKPPWKTCLRYFWHESFFLRDINIDINKGTIKAYYLPLRLHCLSNGIEDVWRQEGHSNAPNRFRSGACESFSQCSLRGNSRLSKLSHGAIGQMCNESTTDGGAVKITTIVKKYGGLKSLWESIMAEQVWM